MRTLQVLISPYRAINKSVAQIIEKEFNMLIVFWNLDTKDYEQDNEDVLPLVSENMEKVLADDSKYYRSFISLQHDANFEEELQDSLISEYKKRNLQFVTAWECFNHRKLYYVLESD